MELSVCPGGSSALFMPIELGITLNKSIKQLIVERVFARWSSHLGKIGQSRLVEIMGHNYVKLALQNPKAGFSRTLDII